MRKTHLPFGKEWRKHDARILEILEQADAERGAEHGRALIRKHMGKYLHGYETTYKNNKKSDSNPK